jgi:tRNA/tmRNA/rRNA uracil-C5-methylase (TrmA/RlmC/RlmD family)
MEPKTPYRRNYLKEAYKIFRGDKKIKPTKEHVRVTMESLVFFQNQTEQLRQLMEYAYDEAVKKRAAIGLPPPPRPPALNKGPDLE